MARKNESILNLLMKSPWWVSVVFSAIVYFLLAVVVPTIAIQNVFLKGIAMAAPKLAPIFALVFLFPAPISFLNSYRKKKLLDKQKDLNSIKSLSWREFEELVAEAYRRKGYSVVENDGSGPDGGVDLLLRKDGNLFLVQCKQWKSYKVDVRVAREMYGVMTAKHAHGVIIITSGLFTQEAKNFAADKPIDLVEGNQLAVLIGSVHSESGSSFVVENGSRTSINVCPVCGGELKLRIAKKGKNSGKKFWGCSNFPSCRFTKTYKE